MYLVLYALFIHYLTILRRILQYQMKWQCYDISIKVTSDGNPESMLWEASV